MIKLLVNLSFGVYTDSTAVVPGITLIWANLFYSINLLDPSNGKTPTFEVDITLLCSVAWIIGCVTICCTPNPPPIPPTDS